jgi:hypothetical protein
MYQCSLVRGTGIEWLSSSESACIPAQCLISDNGGVFQCSRH